MKKLLFIFLLYSCLAYSHELRDQKEFFLLEKRGFFTQFFEIHSKKKDLLGTIENSLLSNHLFLKGSKELLLEAELIDNKGDGSNRIQLFDHKKENLGFIEEGPNRLILYGFLGDVIATGERSDQDGTKIIFFDADSKEPSVLLERTFSKWTEEGDEWRIRYFKTSVIDERFMAILAAQISKSESNKESFGNYFYSLGEWVVPTGILTLLSSFYMAQDQVMQKKFNTETLEQNWDQHKREKKVPILEEKIKENLLSQEEVIQDSELELDRIRALKKENDEKIAEITRELDFLRRENERREEDQVEEEEGHDLERELNRLDELSVELRAQERVQQETIHRNQEELNSIRLRTNTTRVRTTTLQRESEQVEEEERRKITSFQEESDRALRDAENELERLRLLRTQNREKVTRITQEVELLTKENQETKIDHLRRDQLLSERVELEKEGAELKVIEENQQKEILRKRNELALIELKMSVVQKKAVAFQTEVQRVEELERSQGRNSELVRLEEEQSRLQTEKEELKKDLNRVQTQLDQVNRLVRSVQEENQSLRGRFHFLDENFAIEDPEVITIQNEIVRIQNKINLAHEQKREKDLSILEKRRQILDLNRVRNALIERRNSLRIEIERRTISIEGLELDKQTIERDHETRTNRTLDLHQGELNQRITEIEAQIERNKRNGPNLPPNWRETEIEKLQRMERIGLAVRTSYFQKTWFNRETKWKDKKGGEYLAKAHYQGLKDDSIRVYREFFEKQLDWIRKRYFEEEIQLKENKIRSYRNSDREGRLPLLEGLEENLRDLRQRQAVQEGELNQSCTGIVNLINQYHDQLVNAIDRLDRAQLKYDESCRRTEAEDLYGDLAMNHRSERDREYGEIVDTTHHEQERIINEVLAQNQNLIQRMGVLVHENWSDFHKQFIDSLKRLLSIKICQSELISS